MDKKLEDLKKKYMETPIPKELDEVVQSAIKRNEKKSRRPIPKSLIGLAAAMVILLVSINTSPAFAKSLAKIPVVGPVIEVLTIQEIHVKDDNYNADIRVPEVNNFENKGLEKSLNQKYLKENKQLYETFKKKMEELEAKGGGHLSIDSNYKVITDNAQIFTIKRSVVKTEASSYTTVKYDTIDKQKQIMLTLPILFKNDDYIEAISEAVKDQMRVKMKKDPNQIYWVSGAGVEDLNLVNEFEHITADQSFYINEDYKLVIVFDEYEVAPGYMGTSEFVIPTKKIEKELVGDDYIK
ncbi:anti-sigma factor [Virgibacillus phasianinus]|uniref:Anti-sigma factor n=1 Tax=Virgibacillus phasianinus TaxID=2017483 RepID=A0A220U2B1_9BACI|nr:DUF3298 domain-containing protein [Virgibacillus phasianinus]ASK61913.1 anti-sigma factor [Virgibacillus phasianinus]